MNAHPILKPRSMREEPVPALTPALEEAVERLLKASPSALSGVRLAAAAALRRIGLPGPGAEDYSFIRLGDLLPHLGQGAGTAASPARAPMRPDDRPPTRESISRWIFPEAGENHIVLIDGEYAPELSRIGAEYHVSFLMDPAPPDSREPGMHQRFQGRHAAILDRIEAMLGEEYDAPAALAALFAAQPLYVRIPAQRVATSPLQILHVTTGRLRSDAFVVLHAGARSESRILVRHARWGDAGEAGAPPKADGPPWAGMENAHTLAWLEEGASLRYLEQGIDASTSGRDLHLRKLSARLDRDARLVAVSAHTGSRLTRAAFGIDLAGTGADAELNGAAVLSGSRQGHFHVRLRHLVPHGSSRQMFKTVAADQGRASVDGTILVAQDAQQTNAGQRIHNLMLSDDARADSKPRLMIYADDVKCSHGATAGKLDPAQQFYLESRGLPSEKARALLTVAFIAEALDAAGKIGGPFRDALDHALLDALRARMPGTLTTPSAASAASGGHHA